MAAINRVAERIVLDEDFAVITPVIVIRGTKQDANAEIDVDEVGRD